MSRSATVNNVESSEPSARLSLLVFELDEGSDGGDGDDVGGDGADGNVTTASLASVGGLNLPLIGLVATPKCTKMLKVGCVDDPLNVNVT